MTVLLTTHYMDEAQMLCKRIAIVNRGRITRVDSPENLIAGLGSYAVDTFDGVHTSSRFFSEKHDALNYVAESPYGTTLRTTTLEDVFLEETGCSLGGSM